MDWHTLLLEIWHLLREHWLNWIISVILLAIGSWWGKRRARAEWSKKRFLDRINFSLNTLQDGKLSIRTLIEDDCHEVFLNDIAVGRIEAAARKTTSENAILPLAKDERWYLLNAVLNAVSERFAVGFLKRDMGLPVNATVYLVCLTYENAGELKTRKIRAMLIQKAVLLNLPETMPQFEQPHHRTRFDTLKRLAVAFGTDPTNFLEVEICI
jgi:hypothetical protein